MYIYYLYIYIYLRIYIYMYIYFSNKEEKKIHEFLLYFIFKTLMIKNN